MVSATSTHILTGNLVVKDIDEWRMKIFHLKYKGSSERSERDTLRSVQLGIAIYIYKTYYTGQRVI